MYSLHMSNDSWPMLQGKLCISMESIGFQGFYIKTKKFDIVFVDESYIFMKYIYIFLIHKILKYDQNERQILHSVL